MRQVSTKYDTSLFLTWQDNFPLMRKEQARRLYVIFAITSTLLTFFILFILFINNNQFQILLAQNKNNNSSNSNASIVKAVTTTKSPYSANDTTGNGVTTLKPTPALASSNPTQILESFLNPKNLLGTTIDQIRNSTARNDNSNNQTLAAASNATIFVRNPRILLLSHQIIPPKDFIPVYEAMPYGIINARIYAKLPCDSNSKPSLQILAGQLSEVKPAQLKLITALSQPGYMCMYYANLTSTNNDTVVSTNATSKVSKVGSIIRSGVRANNLTITYIELLNPTEYRVVLPSTASLSVSVSQIMPSEELHHSTGSTGVN